MKYLIILVVLLAIIIIGFFVWSWFVPIHIGYKDETSVSFYRFEIVMWAYSSGHGKLVVFEKLGGVYDYFQYLIGRHDPLQ